MEASRILDLRRVAERREFDETKSTVGNDWERPEPEMEPMMVAPTSIGLGKTLLYWLLGYGKVFRVDCKNKLA